MKFNKLFLALFLVCLFFCTERLAAQSKDAILSRYRGRVSYQKKRYVREIRKIKTAMIKDYRKLQEESERAGKLELAQDYRLKIEELEAARDDANALGIEFLAPISFVELLEGNFAEGNLALASRGASAKAPGRPELLIDGNSTKYTGNDGFASGSWPCEMTVTLADIYSISCIRFLLWDGGDRYYRYRLSVSADGEEWIELADCSEGEWRSWQQYDFPPKRVKYIRLEGLFNSANAGFYVVELEAYCRYRK